MGGDVVALVVTFMAFFHPHKTGGNTSSFIADVVVAMIAHVVANAVLVSVLVPVLVVMVSTAHHGQSHVERFHLFCFKIEDIVAWFQMVDAHHCPGWAP